MFFWKFLLMLKVQDHIQCVAVFGFVCVRALPCNLKALADSVAKHINEPPEKRRKKEEVLIIKPRGLSLSFYDSNLD